VRLGKFTSNTCTISTGAPQRCALCLIHNCDKSGYRQVVRQLAVWCSTLKTVEILWTSGETAHHHEQHCGSSHPGSWTPPSLRKPKVGHLHCLIVRTCISKVKNQAGNIITDPSHPGHSLFALLP